MARKVGDKNYSAREHAMQAEISVRKAKEAAAKEKLKKAKPAKKDK